MPCTLFNGRWPDARRWPRATKMARRRLELEKDLKIGGHCVSQLKCGSAPPLFQTEVRVSTTSGEQVWSEEVQRAVRARRPACAREEVIGQSPAHSELRLVGADLEREKPYVVTKKRLQNGMRSKWKHHDMESGGGTVPRREPATSIAEGKLSRMAGITGTRQLSSDLADSVLTGRESFECMECEP